MLANQEQQQLKRAVEFIGVYATGLSVACEQGRSRGAEKLGGVGARGDEEREQGRRDPYDIGRDPRKQGVGDAFSPLSQTGLQAQLFGSCLTVLTCK